MNETVCPQCGKPYQSGPSCPEVSLAGRALPNGLQVIERLGAIPLGELYLAEDGALWATFEVLRGQLLSETLSAADLLPQYKSIALVLQAASGLQAAHEAGLVHGDLSPDSILVTSSADNRPLVKLIRFGSVQLWGKPAAASGASTEYAAWRRPQGHAGAAGAGLHRLPHGIHAGGRAQLSARPLREGSGDPCPAGRAEAERAPATRGS